MALISFHLIGSGSQCPGQGSHIPELSNFPSVNKFDWGVALMKAVFKSAHQELERSSHAVTFFKCERKANVPSACPTLERKQQQEESGNFHSWHSYEDQSFVSLLSASVTSDTWFSLSACSRISQRERAPECDRGGSQKSNYAGPTCLGGARRHTAMHVEH